MKRPRFSVIVPVYNAMRYLPVTIEACAQAVRSYGNAELLVIDNESSDGSGSFLEEKFSGVATISRAPGVVGAVRNRGGQLATGDFLSFVDADCLVPPDYLQQAAAVLAETTADATGSSYALPYQPHWIEKTWHGLHARKTEGPVHYLNAGNFIVSRVAFDAVGGFDPTLTSGEDAELCRRLTDGGFVIHASNRVSAIHLGNPKSLRHFAFQQMWHGLGMFGTFRHSAFDRPVLMTILNGILSVAGLAVLTFSERSWGVRILIFLALCVAVPVMTVAFRAAQTRRLRRPLRSTILYFVYYWARFVALMFVLSGKDSGRRGDLARDR